MTELRDTARVAVVLADYAATDAINKVNILGAGWAVAGRDLASGAVPPQTLVVFIDVPPPFYGQDFTVSLQLMDQAGQVVQLPGPVGEPQALRVAQIVRAEEPVTPAGSNIPKGVLWSHSQIIFSLPNGLPLPPNQLYTWTIEIDGEHRDVWAVSFYVPGPPPPPVIG